MLVAANYCLYFVAGRGEKPAILLRTCGMVGVLRLQMSQVPDAVVHSFRIEIDEGNFLWRVQLRQRANPRPHEKTEILVLLPPKICVEERRMRGVVDGGKNVGIDVVHRLVMQKRLGESKGILATVPHALFPSIESCASF